MIITLIRSIVLYILVLVVMRLMGKREIGQLQPFELAISIMIADLASIPMTDVGIPITNGIIPILGLLVMHLVISIINIKSIRGREILCGRPTILIYRGKIDEKALKKERFTINELEERLRGNNVVNLGDVEYAILETSGQVTVIQKPNKRTTTPEDFNIEPEYEGLPYDLVIDGKTLNENLRKIYVEAYTVPENIELIHKKTAVQLQKIFAPYLPGYSASDFYEMEIGTAAFMRGYMARPCDMYFTLERKLARFLSMSLSVFKVPQEEQEAILSYIENLNIREIANKVMQQLFVTLEMKYEFTLTN